VNLSKSEALRHNYGFNTNMGKHIYVFIQTIYHIIIVTGVYLVF